MSKARDASLDGNQPDALFGFPCAFPLKIIGQTDAGLPEAVLEVVQRHAPDFSGATMEIRVSSAGKFLSLTCTINAVSRHQLDALYRELSGHRLVKLVL